MHFVLRENQVPALLYAMHVEQKKRETMDNENRAKKGFVILVGAAEAETHPQYLYLYKIESLNQVTLFLRFSPSEQKKLTCRWIQYLMQISMGQFDHSICHYVDKYGGRHMCCISLNKYESCCSLTKFLPLGEKIHFDLDPTSFF